MLYDQLKNWRLKATRAMITCEMIFLGISTKEEQFKWKISIFGWKLVYYKNAKVLIGLGQKEYV